MLKVPKRFVSIQCMSKKAKVVRVKAENFFSKLKDEEAIKNLTSLALKKLKFMSKMITEYEQ